MLIVTFSSAIAVISMAGACRQDEPWTSSSCALVLTIFDRPGLVVLDLLALMIATTILIMIILTDWKIGVSRNPWNVSELARLGASQDLKATLCSFVQGKDSVQYAHLRSTTFILRSYIYGENVEQFDISP